MKILVNGREVHQTIVQGTIKSLFEYIDALKNDGNNKYPPEQISEVKSDWFKYRNFLNFSADLALRGVESEFDLTFHSGIVKIESEDFEISIHTRGGIVQYVEF